MLGVFEGIRVLHVLPSSLDLRSSRLEFQKGFGFPTYSKEGYLNSSSNESLRLLRGTGAEWVGIQANWAMDTRTSTIVNPDNSTPTDESLIAVIDLAHSLGMKVMLRPIVSVLDGTDRKEIAPTSWSAWFTSYRAFVVYYAELATENGVELLMIGSELDSSVIDESEWRSVIAATRAVYAGDLTYGASAISCITGGTRDCLPGYQKVSWWDALDFAGVDAYYPLTNVLDPSLEELMIGWARWLPDLERWQASIGKPVVFTEVGYASYRGSNTEPGRKISLVKNPAVSLTEQVNCYEATFRTFYGMPWFRGMYWWRWDTDPNAGGSGDWTYTPQNKLAQEVVTAWYAKDWDNTATSRVETSTARSKVAVSRIPSLVPVAAVVLVALISDRLEVLEHRRRSQ